MRPRLTPSVVFFLLLALGFGAYLVFGEKPDDAGIAFAESEGRDPVNAEFGVTGMWMAAAACAVISLGLAGIGAFMDLRWNFAPAGITTPRYAWIAGGTGCLLLLLLAAPRLRHSLWQDEATTVRRVIAGQYKRANEQGRFDDFGERLRHREIRWADTLWEYRTPNNHPLYSITARILNDTESHVDAGGGRLFSEWRIRLPSLLTGLGMILLAPLVVHRLGGRMGAVIATPILLALSPMVVRWSSEARGYGMSAFFAMAMLWTLLRAVERPSWIRWMLFALCQFGMLYAYPTWAFTFALLNAFAFLGIAASTSTKEEHIGIRWRLTAASVTAGMTFLFLFLPNYLQMKTRMGDGGPAPDSEMGWEKAKGLWSYLTTARMPAGGSEFLPGIADIASPILQFACLGVAGGLLAGSLAGVVFLVTKGRRFWWVALPLLLASPVAFYVSKAQGVSWFNHYLTFFTPMVVLLAALGIAGWARGRLGVPLAVGLISVYGAANASTLRALIVHPSEKNREAAEIAYDGKLPDAKSAPTALHAGMQMYTRNYDPWIIRIKSMESLERVIALARDRGAPLHVQFGQWGLTNQLYPNEVRLLESSGQFEKVATLHGTNHDFDRHVYRLVPVED
ncbi:MAG: glycosyltransferase family 39 protein [Verrucomicrobiota bacterium]